jgi:alkylhydroperoxidase family enzyme
VSAGLGPIIPLTPEEAARLGPLVVLEKLQPRVVGAYRRVGTALADGAIEATLKELVRLRSARITGCEY